MLLSNLIKFRSAALLLHALILFFANRVPLLLPMFKNNCICLSYCVLLHVQQPHRTTAHIIGLGCHSIQHSRQMRSSQGGRQREGGGRAREGKAGEGRVAVVARERLEQPLPLSAPV